MDALQMLREDHRKVKELFRRFEEAQDKATKQAAAETALVELNIHSVLEEEIFYPAVRRQGNGSGAMVKRAEEEHHVAEQLMDELMSMEPGNQDFDAKFHVLIENVKSHIDEEEAEMLPQAAEAGLARMEQLGERMAARRNQLLSEGTGRARPRSRSTSGTRSRAAAGTRTRASTVTRTKASDGTRPRSATSRAKTGSGTTASTRSRTASRPRTVAQAGTRKRTTKTRSNTGSRRSGSQSGR